MANPQDSKYLASYLIWRHKDKKENQFLQWATQLNLLLTDNENKR